MEGPNSGKRDLFKNNGKNDNYNKYEVEWEKNQENLLTEKLV